ncbi:GNAT family N-acyltransferase [Alteromonas sp. ASW11-36]|uniref:L-ornithine N(alpha)-acyltransferase n=1 Tax=Alteromonas arenosi TaxID=3055817 RepID=A0ABT7SS59_9ALTE|nr:GNAT family N-acyltransferase [Alteromonas sp. ASW11-36]MDM7859005.1 GNAT family N-acyltransferase [Alteromonas sp. ASW11-36]
MQKRISLHNLIEPNRLNFFVKGLVSAIDIVLGIRKMNRLYQQHKMQGLTKEAFADRLLEILNIRIEGEDELLAKIPRQGPVVIASNHPFGGIEGVILARVVSKVRPDLKVLANQGLRIFSELQDYFIFTNPLSEKDPRNAPSLRHCLGHVKAGSALLMFPAGRVSYYRKDKQRIAEHEWNRIVARLCKTEGCHYLPVFVSGTNSKWFYRLGRVYYRLRMLMLARELLNKQNAIVRLDAGYPVPGKLIESPAQCRILSYAQSQAWQERWPPDTVTEMKPLAAPVAPALVTAELNALPAEQHLLAHKQYDIYFGFQAQMPNVVMEIARLRELVFREHNEGSGEPIDTDGFDATYTHLLVFDRENNEIVGAYRMGQTDRLIAESGIDGLYLHRMFDFKPGFINRTEPCLEMGRSFLVPRMQRSHVGLFLLWRGIGAFVCKHPQYRTLYGTVSISKLYDPRSVQLIQQAYVTPTEHVTARLPFTKLPHPEITDFADGMKLQPQIKALLASLEHDSKDIPILMKQYHKLGAKFHCLGIDGSFNHTPGLLLSVDLPAAPEKLLKLYLSDGAADYLAYSSRPLK